ncbi:hypothetical protein ADH76_11320 [Enterocloster clostridioformis]|nr:ATP-binding cassette domain-containing protein [Enterocloster clostridioformis]ANU48296.1 hypothetical protein A4V08_23290 [Lachnoclostridium sp. YL32]NDO29461.1 ATP-binding cassette domain-containing protein [Enterocloster clostridioformis]OXE68999.1 hypothetical protein ADH76_11320 [Enterocloster clostridioformis]QQR02817.1 ATP-binding cassette domain-containing protein [Enterocloster clostridioformis]
MDYIITTNSLTKTYAKATKPALSNINLSVKKGEVFGLLGPNGAGKSTLTLLLATLTEPSSGDALVGGHSIISAPDKVRTCLGYCPQKTSLDEELTAWENMLLYVQLAGFRGQAAKEYVNQLLKEAALTEKSLELVKNFSGGMSRRLEIMGAMIGQPQVIFLDEPTVGLDPVFRREIWQQILKARDNGSTIFLSTHYMEEAEELCDRIAIIDTGEIKVVENPKNLKEMLGEAIHLRVFNDTNTVAVSEKIKTLDNDAVILNSPNELHIFTFKGEIMSSSLIKTLKSDNLAIKSISYSSATLDDVYLYYVGQRIFEETV